MQHPVQLLETDQAFQHCWSRDLLPISCRPLSAEFQVAWWRVDEGNPYVEGGPRGYREMYVARPGIAIFGNYSAAALKG